MIINVETVPFLNPNLNVTHFDLSKNTTYENYVNFYYPTEQSEYCQNNDVYLLLINHHDLGKFDLDIVIPTDILNRIRNKEVILALDYLGEAFVHVIYQIYDHLVDRQNIPASQILLIEHSVEIATKITQYCEKYNKEPIKYEVFYLLEKMTQRGILLEMKLDTGYNKHVVPNIKSPLLKTSFPKKFLFLNKIWRRHRTILMMLLRDKDLLKDAHASFFNMSYWPSHIEDVSEKFEKFIDVIERQKSVINQLPIVLDTPMFENSINKFRRTMLKYYGETYFSVVTETSYDNDHLFFPTEKVFKPILYKHPFVVVSTPNYLKNLRGLGYKTFDGIIDESYDSIYDDTERMSAILNEITRLSNLSESELEEFRTKALEIVEYNFNVLMTKKTFLQKLL